MSTSIFNKVYSYREREGGNARENFLIEIFAFSLKHSEVLFKEFASNFGIESPILGDVIIRTQVVYPEGRPDLELIIGDHHILIECKVDADEGNNQLNNYLNILKNRSNIKNKHLLFLTKRYENRDEIEGNDIAIYCLQWSEIYKMIPKEDAVSTIYQFKKYLKEQNMNDKSFNLNDMTTMLVMTNTISKMDEVLDRVKTNLPEGFGEISKSSSRRTRISDNWYGNYRHFKNYHMWWGFYWSDDDCKVPELFVQIKSVSYGSNTEGEPIMVKIINETNFEDFGEVNKGIDAWNTKSMIEFMKNDNDNIHEMSTWILDEIKTVYKYGSNS